jgi:hypothetical protein
VNLAELSGSLLFLPGCTIRVVAVSSVMGLMGPRTQAQETTMASSEGEVDFEEARAGVWLRGRWLEEDAQIEPVRRRHALRDVSRVAA